MSFLAQLRQSNTSQTVTGVQLTYQLRLAGGGLMLRLALAELAEGQLKTAGQDYLIQAAHLRALPHFLTDADGSILSQLLQHSANWQQTAELCCAQGLSLKLLHAIADSGKAFWLEPQGRWRGVWLAPASAEEWHWVVQSDATQVLTRRLPEGMVHCRVGDASCACSARGEIVPLLPKAGSDRPTLAGAEVAVVALDEFVARNSQALAASGLPRPRPLFRRHCHATLQCTLQCETRHNQSTARLVYHYSGERLCIQAHGDPGGTLSLWDGETAWLIERDEAAEEHAYRCLKNLLQGFFEGSQRGVWFTQNTVAWRQLFLDNQSELDSLDIQLYALPGFAHQYAEVDQWAMEIQDSGDAMQLDLTLQVQGQRVDALNVLQALGPEDQWIINDDGQLEWRIDGLTVVLPKQLCGFLREEFADLMAWGQLGRPIPITQRYRLSNLQAALPESTQWHGDVQLLEQAMRLANKPPSMDIRAAGVNAKLRPYQKLGVAWLQHLRENGVSGLLADDMGLGKTLQTITHLALEFHSGRAYKPALVVAPTSLIHNWQREFAKFCPQLSVQVFHGAKRHDLRTKLNSAQVLITSYNLAVLDLELWLRNELSWLILDEAQTIKNPRTQVRRAVAQMPAEFRLCLSGTPVENHLAELWSVMDFLAPGVLGSQSQFRNYYQKPIEQQGDAALFSQLLRRLAPLMLRRTKSLVAADLPEKTVIKQMVVMSEPQASYYQSVKQHSWQALLEELVQEQSEGQKQLRILTAITKLRQVCCDPQLLGDSGTPSAKTQACVEMVTELVDEGRSVLVFSQFTSMLDILSEHFNQAGIEHFVLTGSTRNRAELVDAFQRGDRPVFLISLKAGGVGLNLTRADTVIHYDPWWNSAAEQQASDRAHRIGQTQPVFVYKLIMEDTIEEKIALMQEAKAQLAEQVHEQAELSGKAFSLSANDLLQLWQDDIA